MPDQAKPLMVMMAILSVIFIIAMIVVIVTFLRMWLRGIRSGESVGIIELIGLWLRGTPSRIVVPAFRELRAGGLSVTLADVEREYCANHQSVTDASSLIQLMLQQATRVK